MMKRKYEKPTLKAKGPLAAVTASGPITLIVNGGILNGGDDNGGGDG